MATPTGTGLVWEERGGVVVLVALLLPFIIGLLALAIDVGHWYEHRRHLQVQVDAAALAGGSLFSDCLTKSSATVQSEMQVMANQYGGVSGSPLYNPQIGGTTRLGNVQFGYQSPTYPTSQPSGWAADNTPSGQSACNSGMLDVKATESGIPHFFLTSPLATVHAHARVELRLVNEQSGLLPIGVPDTRFNFAFATFINEATGLPLATDVPLQKTGVSGGLQQWSTSGLASVPTGAATQIGVRIRLVGGTDPTAGCSQLYTECYDAGSANGLVYIHGWSGSASTPRVADAWLLPGTCAPDAYFATADCSAGIQAAADLGVSHPLSGNGASAKVWASVDGSGTYQLSQGAGGGLVTWTLPSGLPITGGGPHPVTLDWSWQQTAGSWNGNICKSTGRNPCVDSGTFSANPVQRAFEASPDLSGPLQRVQIFSSGVSSGANSWQQGSPMLGVSLATSGSLAVQAAASAAVIYLRVIGSQTGSINCDPALPNIRDEITSGCAPLYSINLGTSCPARNALWGTPQPWNCVKTQSGGATGQVKQGMATRVGGSCPVWPYTGNQQDPRVIPLIVTPFGTFTGSGNDIVPVIDFATFYVMGFEGDKCANSVPVPKGFIAGHFIKYIPPTPQGVGDTTCFLTDPSQIEPCVPVLTR